MGVRQSGAGAVPIAGALVYLTRVAILKIPNEVYHYECDNMTDKPYTWVRDNSAYSGAPLMVTYPYDFGRVFFSVYGTSNEWATSGPVSLLDTPLRRGGILLGPAKHGLDIQFRPSQDTLSPPLIVNQYPVFLTGPATSMEWLP